MTAYPLMPYPTGTSGVVRKSTTSTQATICAAYDRGLITRAEARAALSAIDAVLSQILSPPRPRATQKKRKK